MYFVYQNVVFNYLEISMVKDIESYVYFKELLIKGFLFDRKMNGKGKNNFD